MGRELWEKEIVGKGIEGNGDSGRKNIVGEVNSGGRKYWGRIQWGKEILGKDTVGEVDNGGRR